jgi:phenylacetic acid degradation operon negative regulatory protein
MLAAGELDALDGDYTLGGRLLERQARQQASRHADTRPWDGTWELALVHGADRRSAAERSALREALTSLRLAELREGVWLRPANLPDDRVPEERAVAREQCVWVRDARPEPAPDIAHLWDIEGWAAEARVLHAELAEWEPALDAGSTDVLGPAFEVAAAVLRHLQHDPLLPVELLPRDWPGGVLRDDYERYDRAFKQVWRSWFRTARTTT